MECDWDHGDDQGTERESVFSDMRDRLYWRRFCISYCCSVQIDYQHESSLLKLASAYSPEPHSLLSMPILVTPCLFITLLPMDSVLQASRPTLNQVWLTITRYV